MSFSNTCDDISLDSGTTLAASCRNDSGNYVYSTLNLDSFIGNGNGSLYAGGSNFTESSTNVYLNGTVLNASCRTDSGTYVSSSIDLNDYITNDNGELEYTG